MRIDVFFTPLGLSPGDVSGQGVVVIDVLRATTTVITAIANGAKAVIPAASSEEAVRLASNLEKDGVLLAGERKSLKIEGFALGNSPREMTPEVVAGKTIVLATTNGTPALVAAQRAALVEGGALVVVCSGRERQFALEDAYTAGRLVKAVKPGLRKLELNDAAAAALALTAAYDGWEDALERTAAARQLVEANLADDVAFAAQQDRFGVVPQYAERRIT